MATKRLLVQQPGKGDRWQALQAFDDGRYELQDLDTPQAARWQKEGGFEIVPGERFNTELSRADARKKAQATERGLSEAGWFGGGERGDVTGISMRPAAGDTFDVEASFSGGTKQRAGMDRARAAALQGLMGANVQPAPFKGLTMAQEDEAARGVANFQAGLKKPFQGLSAADAADAERKVAAFQQGLQARPMDSASARRPGAARTVQVSQVGPSGAPSRFQPLQAPSASTLPPEAAMQAAATPTSTGDAEFAAAQQSAADRELMLGLSRAAQNVNTALTGAPSDRAAFEAMAGQTDSPVRRLLAQRKADEAKRMGDPASEESKRFQAAVAKALPGVYSPEELALMTAGDKESVMRAGEMRQKLDQRKADMERAAGQRQEDIGLEQQRMSQQQQFQAGEAAKGRAFQERMARQAQAADLQEAQLRAAGGGAAGRIPAGEAQSLGQADFALQTLADVSKGFEEKTGPFSGVTQYLPGTSATQYDDQRRAAAQTIGTFLEGGKLTEGDLGKYMSLLPSPGDGKERASAKVTNLQKMISQRRSSQLQGLQQAGYNTAGFQTASAPAPTAAAPAGDMVPMVDPQGRQRMVPRSRVDAALAAGGRLVNG